MQIRFTFLMLLLVKLAFAQYPPAAGLPGSTAMAADSNAFINWATHCVVERGPQQIDQLDLGSAEAGMPEMATQMADGTIVSLGDGGTATLTFQFPIQNGEGPDFAVFENGFPTGDAYFLELAFVEVSSDGVHFVRFPAISLTGNEEQVGSFESLQPEKLHHLAGKYTLGYGVPFDLDELADEPNLDVNAVTHVRIIDVVGSIDPAYAKYDAQDNIINDPWPTPFPSSGFDLDAIGVIHQNTAVSATSIIEEFSYEVYPNPVSCGNDLQLNSPTGTRFMIVDANGRAIMNDLTVAPQTIISTFNWQPGWYVIILKSDNACTYQKILIMP
ncbi:MAG: T9SS type A sorting domain-containing protein [Saprospiraceae bacterium]|nr:T9SS type A sorting domain-containing protein [Saprospiraceae bacterium]